MIIRQRGINKNYPETIQIWKLGEIIPEWLSDRAKISFMDGDGNLTLASNKNSTGGFEIKASTGNETLVSTKTSDSIICYSEGYNIFSLTPIQFELLYEIIDEKNDK